MGSSVQGMKGLPQVMDGLSKRKEDLAEGV